MPVFNVGYELYEEDQEINPRGVYLIEASSQEAAMDTASMLLQGQEFGFLDVYETEHRPGDVSVIVAK